MISLLPYSVLLERFRILGFIILLSVCIYATYYAYIIITGIIEPQPITKNLEIPQLYSDIFSSEGYFCAAPTGEDYGTATHDEIQVCFLRLSAKNADWIRQEFANIPPGTLLLGPNDSLWNIHLRQEAPGLPILHDNPLEEMDVAHLEERKEREGYTTLDMVFLRWLTLRLLIDQMNPNNLIHYSEVRVEHSIYRNFGKCVMFNYGTTSCVDYYIPLKGNFLFRRTTYSSHYM
ncbi:hypothetical protein QRD38_07820 [Leptospira weilii]|uniref:hypothetical protein n=1 Tax=Leptospira weilii TaxID=28184 RepID=UPI00256F5F3F|nr:hypothetical protein [Leptospira weilii]MDL5245703.1 hypothetical protein [Leptospira weilii]